MIIKLKWAVIFEAVVIVVLLAALINSYSNNAKIEKPQIKEVKIERQGPKVIKEEKRPMEKMKKKQPTTGTITKKKPYKKSKEDVFVKLKKVTKEIKEEKQMKNAK